jgi:hypothetical protein
MLVNTIPELLEASLNHKLQNPDLNANQDPIKFYALQPAAINDPSRNRLQRKTYFYAPYAF